MRLRVSQPSEGVLRTEVRPDYGFDVVIIVGMQVLAVWVVMAGPGRPWWAIILPLAAVIPIVYVFAARSIIGRFDRASGEFAIVRSGLLGSSILRRVTKGKIESVAYLEMRQRPNRGADGFQLRMRLKNDEVIEISGHDLGYNECQVHAQAISEIIGIVEAPRAVERDW